MSLPRHEVKRPYSSPPEKADGCVYSSICLPNVLHESTRGSSWNVGTTGRAHHGYGDGAPLLDPLLLILTEDERSIILRVFAAARRHVKYIAVLKFSSGRRLPWVLAGLAHHDRGVAMARAVRALDFFSQGLDAGRGHWISRVLCTPGELGHTKMQ